MTGQITKIISNLYTVSHAGKSYECRARGKFRQDNVTPLVGDFCQFDENNNYITDIMARNNELTRPSVANVDLALIVTSLKEPKLSLNLLDKLLSTIIWHQITPVICLSKLDLINQAEKKELKKIIKYYQRIGVPVVKSHEKNKLKRIIKGKLVVLAGQSGAGKSTLLNYLNPRLQLETKPISKALGRGVHTTRHVELFNLYGGLIADTPGFSSLDFSGLDPMALKNTFPELSSHNCYYQDCMHLKEDKCMIKEFVEQEKILPSRYENYKLFIKEIRGEKNEKKAN